jgi:hypothetical protein
MPMKKILIPLITALMIASAAQAADKDVAWETMNAIKRDFQQSFFESAVAKWPEYKELLMQYRELQLAKIERRSMIYYYWLENEPDRIVRDQGIERYLNFQWTRRDIAIFNAKVEGFKELNQRVEYLNSKNYKDKDWKKFTAVLSSIATDADYKKLLADMAASFEAGKILINPPAPAAIIPPALSGNRQTEEEAAVEVVS